MKRISCVFVTFFLLLTGSAVAGPTDFDGDGVSDFTLIQPQGDSSLAWVYRASSNSKVLTLGSLGSLGNHISLGAWTGANRPELSVISPGPSGDIVWTVQRGDGTISQISHGSVNDLAMAGADLDGSGIVDAIAIQRAQTGLTWQVLLNPLSGAPAGFSFAFGDATDVPFFIERTNAPDSAAVMREEARGRVIYVRDSVTGSVSSFVVGSGPSSPLRPISITRDGESFVVLAQRTSRGTELVTYREDGRVVSKRSVRGRGDVIVGNFLSTQPGMEVAVQNGRSFSVINPFSGITRSIRVGAGIAIDEVNVNTLGTWGGGAVCEPRNPRDGFKRGFIWKPNSDTQRFAVTVLPADLTGRVSKLEILTSAGALIKEILSKGCGNPDDIGPRCAYQDRQYTGQEYARLFGALSLRVSLKDGSCLSFAVPDPSKRLD